MVQPALSNPNTLVVDDETNIRFFLQATLEKSGHHVTQADSGELALELLRETFYDLAILDLNLGGPIDGLRLLEAIRWRWPATVVVILTGHGSFESALSAIQEGVDGYILKPADAGQIRKSVDEAVQRALRRFTSQDKPSPSVFHHNGLALDPDRYRLEVEGRLVDVTAHEFRLLAYMLSKPACVFTARELVRVVQQYEPESEQEGREIIKWYIHRLRKKIEPDPNHPRYLLNVRGVGYKLG